MRLEMNVICWAIAIEDGIVVIAQHWNAAIYQDRDSNQALENGMEGHA
jgi:hypothetical protein